VLMAFSWLLALAWLWPWYHGRSFTMVGQMTMVGHLTGAHRKHMVLVVFDGCRGVVLVVSR